MVLWVWSCFVGGNAGVEGKWLEKQLNLGDGNRGIRTAGSHSVQTPAWLVVLAWGDEWPRRRGLGGQMGAEALHSSVPRQP